jgi:D-3-phosphoglycerate dehydrogenase / 2-oxoglutarate reductase
MRILVCDGLEKTGVDLLSSAEGILVDERPDIKADEIKEIIADYEGMIVRSKTQVTAELIERAAKLKVVGRAGTGVDNIDVAAATRRGIIVMNAAAGNTVTTAEHTWAMARRRVDEQNAGDHWLGAHRLDRCGTRPRLRDERFCIRPLFHPRGGGGLRDRDDDAR